MTGVGGVSDSPTPSFFDPPDMLDEQLKNIQNQGQFQAQLNSDDINALIDGLLIALQYTQPHEKARIEQLIEGLTLAKQYV
jgi:hypothetical protein